jgi:hypothetical protein
MKKIIPLLWIILLLSSCYSNPKDLKKIEELQNINTNLEIEIWFLGQEKENNVFQKNKECRSLIGEIDFSSDYWGTEVNEVFFSKKEQECFYTIIESFQNSDTYIYIEKLLSLSENWRFQSSIVYCRKLNFLINHSEEIQETVEGECTEFKNKIQELKN